MLVYKVSEHEGGSFYYRESDELIHREFISFLEHQEAGNSIFIEVVDITREEFNGHSRMDRM